MEDQISDIVRRAISEKLCIEMALLHDFKSLWDMGADDLDYVDLATSLEEQLSDHVVNLDNFFNFIDSLLVSDIYTIGQIISNIVEFIEENGNTNDDKQEDLDNIQT